MKKANRSENPELDFAADVFCEVGAQYKAMKKLGILWVSFGHFFYE